MTLLAAASTSDRRPGQNPLDENPLDRVLRALNHPVRRQILRALLDGEGSASTLSKSFDMDLGVVSYHLNQVLARECGIVELVRAVPRRGALEKFFVLKFDALTPPRSPGGEAREPDGPPPMSLEECFIAAAAAMDAGALAQLPGSAWEWFPAAVDPIGWAEICQARADFNRRVGAAVEKSRARDDENLREVVVGAAAFPR